MNEELNTQLMETNDPAEVEKIVGIFNSHLQKRSIIRQNTISDLQDKLLSQLSERIDKLGNNLTVTDINQTIKTLADASKYVNTPIENNVPQIAVTNNTNTQINIGGEELDREARERILAAVAAISGGNVETNDE